MGGDPCSARCYEELVEEGYIGKRQAMVLSIFIEHRRLTGLEAADLVAERFGSDIRNSETVRNRITELTAQGLLRKIEKVVSPLTSRVVNRWEWTGRTEPVPPPARFKCPTCDGSGFVEVLPVEAPALGVILGAVQELADRCRRARAAGAPPLAPDTVRVLRWLRGDD